MWGVSVLGEDVGGLVVMLCRAVVDFAVLFMIGCSGGMIFVDSTVVCEVWVKVVV